MNCTDAFRAFQQQHGAFILRQSHISSRPLGGRPPSMLSNWRHLLSASLSSQDDQSTIHSNTIEPSGMNEKGLFEAPLWDMYESTLRTVIESRRVRRNTKDEEELDPIIMDCLLANRAFLPPPPLCCFPNEKSGAAHDDFRHIMSEQKQHFLNQTGWTEANYNFAMRTLTYMGDYCAKTQSPGPLLVAWHKLKEAGMVPRENCISTYLYVLSLWNQNNQTTSLEQEDISEEVAIFHDLLYEPNEKTATLRIKYLIANGDATGAEELLNAMSKKSSASGDWTKLRTYVPILALYCSNGDVSSALRLFKQMRNSSGVIFEPETYALLIGTLAEKGYFRRGCDDVPGAAALGFLALSGPRLLDELAAEMAEDILEINDDSARILYNAFATGFRETEEGRHLHPLSANEQLLPDSNFAANDELVIGRVPVDENTAICPRTHAKLRLLRLEEEQRKEVHDTLLEMAAAQYDEFREKLESRFKNRMEDMEGSDFAVRELSRFSSWLDEREGEPFTAIVDGPNVAYFGHSDVRYSQVKSVVKELEKMNEQPLVVMPQKYVAPKFHLGLGYIQELGEKDLLVMNELIESERLYIVPSRCLDDYYWMLASVSNQTRARAGADMTVSTNDRDGRLPGLRPLLLTNDQMRDHKLEILEPRLFRRWCSCHIVNYNLTDVGENEWEEGEIQLYPADFFSREIQGNPTPNSNNATAWHLPVSEWEDNHRLCIRIPR